MTIRWKPYQADSVWDELITAKGRARKGAQNLCRMLARLSDDELGARKSAAELAARVMRFSEGVAHLYPFVEGKRQFQAKKLVVDEAMPGRPDTVHRSGEVDVPEGLVAGHQMIVGDDCRWDRITDRPGASEGIVYGPSHDPGAHVAGRRMDGHHPPRLQ